VAAVSSWRLKQATLLYFSHGPHSRHRRLPVEQTRYRSLRASTPGLARTRWVYIHCSNRRKGRRVRSDVTELNWHGLVFDELANGATGKLLIGHWLTRT